jgi:F-type H+-transporting ATPase subunit b
MEIHIDQILFQIINFGILLFVFKKFLYAPVLKMLDNRASKIQEGMEAAEKNLQIQEDLEKESAEQIANAKKEAGKILREAQKQADILIKDTAAKAKEDARSALTKEREAFIAEMKSVRDQLKADYIADVTDATNAVLRGSLDTKLQQTIIEQQIKSLDTQFN